VYVTIVWGATWRIQLPVLSRTGRVVGDLLKAEIVNVSHHLGVLRETKLVQDEKKGRFVYYSLHPETYRNTDRGETISLASCRLEIGK